MQITIRLPCAPKEYYRSMAADGATIVLCFNNKISRLSVQKCQEDTTVTLGLPPPQILFKKYEILRKPQLACPLILPCSQQASAAYTLIWGIVCPSAASPHRVSKCQQFQWSPSGSVGNSQEVVTKEMMSMPRSPGALLVEDAAREGLVGSALLKLLVRAPQRLQRRARHHQRPLVRAPARQNSNNSNSPACLLHGRPVLTALPSWQGTA